MRGTHECYNIMTLPSAERYFHTKRLSLGTTLDSPVGNKLGNSTTPKMTLLRNPTYN